MTVVATVGTTHPLGFAGLTFAALALAAEAVRPVCIVAGVTAQDAARVTARSAIDVRMSNPDPMTSMSASAISRTTRPERSAPLRPPPDAPVPSRSVPLRF